MKIAVMLIGFLTLLSFSTPVLATRPKADLEVRQEVTSTVVSVPFQYYIYFKNNGPDTASNVVIKDILPNKLQGYVTHIMGPGGGGCDNSGDTITCTFPSVPSGSGGRIDVNIFQIDGKSRNIVNTTKINSDTSDPIKPNNKSSITTQFVAYKDS